MKEDIIKINNVEYVELDIHGYTLYETQTDLPQMVVHYLEEGYTHFRIIHGFNSGIALKNYIRTRLRQDISKISLCGEILISTTSKGDTALIISGL